MGSLIFTIILILSTTATYQLLIKKTINYQLRKGYVGIDIHKPHKPKVPNTSGFTLLPTLIVALLISVAMYVITGNNDYVMFFIYLIPPLVNGLIGLLDDLIVLDAKSKTFLPTLAAIPVILFNSYIPRPYVPILGSLRLTVLYPLAILVAYSVGSNGLNMIDTHNGLVPSITLVITVFSIPLIILNILRGEVCISSMYLALFIIVLALNQLMYNKYPAKIFNGDSGSFLFGSLLISLAILSRIEFYMVTALMPLIINGFQILTSMGGLRERREIKIRPTIIEGHYIKGNENLKAPITLVQLITLKNPLTEPELIVTEILLFILTSCSGLLTILLL